MSFRVLNWKLFCNYMQKKINISLFNWIIVIKKAFSRATSFLISFNLQVFYSKAKTQNIGYGYSGTYDNWADAMTSSGGYQDPQIAKIVCESARSVFLGKVMYERDSVTFASRQYSFQIAAALMWVGLHNNRSLKVLDFGGGFGTSYVQNKPFLAMLDKVTWTIVEQKTFINEARRHFQKFGLIFSENIFQSLSEDKPNLVLLSSSLQYVENPWDVLTGIVESEVEMIVFDRTLFSDESLDFITQQRVPEAIFSALIPVWVFSESKFIEFMDRRYKLISCFKSSQSTVDWDCDGRKLKELGFIFALKGNKYDLLHESIYPYQKDKND